MQKFSKEWSEKKAEARKALDLRIVGGERAVVDTTVGHVEGPPGTWNTTGVELPTVLSSVRDVRPETRDAVSLEGLKEMGVPVRDESDRADLEAAAEVAPVSSQDTIRVNRLDPNAPENVEEAKDDKKVAKRVSDKDEK